MTKKTITIFKAVDKSGLPKKYLKRYSELNYKSLVIIMMKINRRRKSLTQATVLYKISQSILNVKNALKTSKIYNNKFAQYKLVTWSESRFSKRKVVNIESEMIHEDC